MYKQRHAFALLYGAANSLPHKATQPCMGECWSLHSFAAWCVLLSVAEHCQPCTSSHASLLVWGMNSIASFQASSKTQWSDQMSLRPCGPAHLAADGVRPPAIISLSEESVSPFASDGVG